MSAHAIRPRPGWTKIGLALLAGGATVLAAGPVAAQSCARDLECPGEMICEDGQCVEQGGGSSGGGKTAPTDPEPSKSAEPAKPEGPMVTVQFVGRSDDVQVIDVATEKNCITPCSLELPAGLREIKVGGPDGLSEQVAIPESGGTFSVVEYSNVTVGLGGISAFLGLGGIVGGAILMGTTDYPEEGSNNYDERTAAADDKVLAGGLVLGAGVLFGVLTPIFLGVSDFGGVEQVARRNPAIPTLGGAPLVGGGFAGAARWEF